MRSLLTRHRLINANGNTIFCNLNQKDKKHIALLDSKSKKLENTNTRCGLVNNDEGCVIVFSSDKDLVKSSKKFQMIMDAMLLGLSFIRHSIEQSTEAANNSSNRLVHNLTSLNAHNIQEVYSLIPQENVSQKIVGSRSYVEDIVRNNPKETAITLLRIAKNNAAMKAEFSVFRKLFDSNPSLQLRKHNIHKVLMNIFYLFFSDFTDKNVRVSVGPNEIKIFAKFDYESFHVAVYHIIENAAKYIKQDSNLDVNIIETKTHIEIVMDMISLEIKNSEKETIFEEGVSGELAYQLSKSGDGIGMNRARRILELNSGQINVEPHPSTRESYMGVPFQRNVFTIRLPPA